MLLNSLQNCPRRSVVYLFSKNNTNSTLMELVFVFNKKCINTHAHTTVYSLYTYIELTVLKLRRVHNIIACSSNLQNMIQM